MALKNRPLQKQPRYFGVLTTMSEVLTAPEFTKEMEPTVASRVYCGLNDFVESGSIMLDIETQKVILEVTAPIDGVVTAMNIKQGEALSSGQPLFTLEPSEKPFLAIQIGTMASNNAVIHTRGSSINFNIVAIGVIIGLFTALIIYNL